MKLKYEFTIREVCGIWAAVAVGEKHGDFNGVISLNETGADIMKLLVDDITEEDLIRKMLEIYDAPEELIRKDVKEFIEKLNEDNVLV